MPVVKQLSIFLENRPGMLHDVTSALAEHGVNLLALTIADHFDHAVVRLVPDDPERALRVLEERSVLVVANDVLEVSMPNQQGALAEVSQRLAKARMNIEYAYGSAATRSKTVTLYFRVKDPAKAAKALAG